MQNLVKKTEEYVEEHQQYQDLQQQCHDWVNATNDKISVCAEVGGNRQALQNRMDRLQVLIDLHSKMVQTLSLISKLNILLSPGEGGL